MNHDRVGAGFGDHSRKSCVAAVREFRRPPRAGGTTSLGVVPLIHFPMAGGRIFEDYVGRMCGT